MLGERRRVKPALLAYERFRTARGADRPESVWEGTYYCNGIVRLGESDGSTDKRPIPIKRSAISAFGLLQARQAVNNARRRSLAEFPHYLTIGECAGPFPPEGARLAPAESVEWPQDYYSFEVPEYVINGRVVRGHMHVGTWKVATGKVVLQGADFRQFRAPLTADSAPFGDIELVPWPDTQHEVCKVQGQGDGDEDDDAQGEGVRRDYQKRKLWSRMVDDDYEFFALQIIYWLDCFLKLGYVPQPGRGRRKQAEVDFLAAWLLDFREQGFPSRILELITGRKQQGISQLLKRHRGTLPVEAEPWGSRREFKRQGRDTPADFRFYPNYSTDGPYWKGNYVPHWSYGQRPIWATESEATPAALDNRGKPARLTGERVAGSTALLPARAPDSLGEDAMTQDQAERLIAEAQELKQIGRELLEDIAVVVPDGKPLATVIDLDSRRKPEAA